MKRTSTLKFVVTILLTSMIIAAITPSYGVDWSEKNATRITDYIGYDTSPAVARISDGTTWVMYHSAQGADTYGIFYKVHDGSSWSPVLEFMNETSYDKEPSIIQANDGTIWVVWYSDRNGNFDIYYSTSIDYGSTWSTPQPIDTDPGVDWEPSITQTSDGTIWVAWSSFRTGNDDIFYSFYDGSSWSSPTQFTTDPVDDRNPSILQASDGTLWIAWSSIRTGNFEIFYSTLIEGGSWSDPQQLTNTTSLVTDVHPSLLQPSDGGIWIFWQSDKYAYRGVPQDDLFFTALYGSDPWLDPQRLTEYTGDDIYPTVANLASGEIGVVWTSDRPKSENWDVYYNTLTVRDIAVTNIIPASNVVYQGDTVNINVTTENQGGKTETFQVTCYYDMGVVGLQTVTLTPGQQKTLTFPWNTAGISHAQHLILATAFPYVPDETDPHDNIFYDGEIFVKISGDVNHDGFVNIYDLIVVRDDLGATPENPPSNPDADLNKDGYVNIFDLVIVRDDLGSVH